MMNITLYQHFLSWAEFKAATALHLAGLVLIALVLNRLLRMTTNLIIKPAASTGRRAQLREQQTRTLAAIAYSTGSKVVWAVALLTALPEFGINVTPVAAIAGLASLALGFGAQNTVRDIISGFTIVLEDQFIVGDTIQFGTVVGRVEHLTLRRTVLRDPSGGLVTISNGELRTVCNLNRDWSQAFVDVALAAEYPLEKALEACETAAGGLRGDPAWTPVLLDGPRVLGVQSYERTGCTVRLQVRTAPMRQDEVARELRRRIQLEFQRLGIPPADAQRVVWKAGGGPGT